MEKNIMLLQDIIKKGAWCYIFNKEDSKANVHFLAGGLLPIKFDWVIYFPAFPDGPQDIHDSKITKFKEGLVGAQFTDQFNRDISFTPLDFDDKEEQKLHKEWQKAKEEPTRLASFDRVVRNRLELNKYEA